MAPLSIDLHGLFTDMNSASGGQYEAWISGCLCSYRYSNFICIRLNFRRQQSFWRHSTWAVIFEFHYNAQFGTECVGSSCCSIAGTGAAVGLQWVFPPEALQQSKLSFRYRSDLVPQRMDGRAVGVGVVIKCMCPAYLSLSTGHGYLRTGKDYINYDFANITLHLSSAIKID